MERDIIDIIGSKEFIELTNSEKNELAEFFTTEDEYNQLKNVFKNINAMNIEVPNPKTETKRDLDALFVQTYPKAAPIWYNSIFAVAIPKDKPIYRQPLIQVAALALLLFLAIPLFNSDFSKPNQLAENKVVNDDSAELIEVKDTLEGNLQDVKKEIDLAEDSFEEVNVMEVVEPSDGIDIAAQPVLAEISVDSEAGSIATTIVADEIDDAFFDHPDGVFVAAMTEDPVESSIMMSIPASETEDLMDLLTVTF